MTPSNLSPTGRQVTPSLQRLLTVTSPTSINHENKITSASDIAPPSDLVSRLQEFLPQMEHANATLPTEPESVIDLVVEDLKKAEQHQEEKDVLLKERSTKRQASNEKTSKAVDKKESHDLKVNGSDDEVKSLDADANEDGDGSEDENDEQRVEMHLFIDDSMGMLVPSQDAAKRDGQREINSLVRDISDTTATMKQ